MEFETERTNVVNAGLKLKKSGLIVRTWGNISSRAGENAFVVTPSGLAYDVMKPADVVKVDLKTGEWEGERKPSVERGVHAAAYTTFGDANFVVHTHQTYATALSLCYFDGLELTDSEKEKLGGVAIAAYGLPGSDKLKNAVYDAMQTGAHCVLMAHHGALAVGTDPDDAFERAALLEEVCLRACKGQDVPDVSEENRKKLRALTDAIKDYPYIMCSDAPEIVAASKNDVHASLDDMAQMIGARIVSVEPDEKKLARALKTHCAVLVSGLGVICRADTENDCESLVSLAHKSCVCELHARACSASGRLSLADTLLMRAVYIYSYSKKAGR